MAESGSVSRARRQSIMSDLIAQGIVASQSQLRALMEERGLSVNQSTLSRDLADIGAIRVRGDGGGLVYALSDDTGIPGATLDRLCADMMISASASGNLVVVRTPPGGAQYFANGLDRAGWDTVLGSVAGDDTVMVVTRDEHAGQRVVAQLMSLVDGRNLMPTDNGSSSPAADRS
ncbi:MAG: arginine repressor [Propionibacteriaceae bacterium]|jgi:transcriptional regulator of arginine metabolism|nr:arginine repressor [Propionibacteriaceae bacterium]